MKNDLEKFIRDNQEMFDKKIPDHGVLDRILDEMQGNESQKPKGILIPFRVVRLVAASIILIACGIVFWTLQKRPEAINNNRTKIAVRLPVKSAINDSARQAQPAEVVKIQPLTRKSVDAVDRDLAVRKQALFTRLKTGGPASEKHVMFAGLNNMESSASRIAAASQSYKLKNTGNDIVDALVNTLNTDPNANVRLAALDGLARFYRDDYVRKKLVASLKKQQDPLVQIALIDLLTRMRESGILTELDKIVNDENTQKAVKDCAYSGIIQLRSS